ncbi:histone acetyltransferase type B catalytic subunit-like [Uloborus diversus]|uniref:histone acetyltransferase type B catalytic subunit-like n=1 Tax=Uloborus diversus TaxID=327109 RepID=UPI002409B712|nr:histone acetyltransferase type B catalytic subunit-like [Uloborus diversus]
MDDKKRKLGEGYLDQFVSDANEVVSFKFVHDKQDLEDDYESFKPQFTHQFFGDSENIFGYIGLHVDLYYTACRLFPYFGMKYREKVKSSITGGIEADDVYKIICDKQEFDMCTDLEEFSAALEKESSFVPYGQMLESFNIKNELDENETFEIYRADLTDSGFQEYHKRMQTLILWLIDAASFIDQEDDRWDCFVLHQKVEDDGVVHYPFVGYMTVYRYYAYPKKTRPRISQMLVLPTYQKRGLGSKLLESVCNWYIQDPEVLDITVEDPSEEFVRIRDCVDCKKCQALPSFAEDMLKKGFSKEMAEEAQMHLKINKKQARRVYEILRLKCTDMTNPQDYRIYRLDVKNRLNAPFQREKLDMEKLQKNLSPEELKAASNMIPREQRLEQLDQMYKDTEAKYKHIIDKLCEG